MSDERIHPRLSNRVKPFDDIPLEQNPHVQAELADLEFSHQTMARHSGRLGITFAMCQRFASDSIWRAVEENIYNMPVPILL
jgi:hypothetical protein